MGFTIKTVGEIAVDERFLADYNRLMTQLLKRPVGITLDEVQGIEARPGSELLVCALDAQGTLQGMVQGSYLHTPPTYSVYLNSVVVDEAVRGAGLGSLLMQEAEVRFRATWPNLTQIHFTSSPKKGTRGFYERLGYVARVPENNNETIVYVKHFA